MLVHSGETFDYGETAAIVAPVGALGRKKMGGENRALMATLEWVVELDVPAIIASVAAERQRRPSATNLQLAESAFSKARWKAAATGVVTGLPANPWTAVPTAAVDVAATLRLEVQAAARVAVIYDPQFFDDEDAKWELLVPVFGLNIGSQAVRKLGVLGGMGATRAAIRKYLSKETLKSFQKIMLSISGSR